ncbi:acylneuraminate cytidylyltransferase family protein [Salegentibacter flavus]|uniref:N-acylneuraminate cytidylyltransferase n=1 Tax=Salegentibacter flavus TaxID=287099 RepID=A0A1I4Y4A9_9FLAO|nr:acylneuraminate cytidylyltransferase family protein [Salegentibacter flavus]SFN32847.1 N-acylneuraminate cytidylyltransferase [Salegentibacter flavus]
MTKKILGLIPARGGSKGIPGKNIKLLGGKPLLQYTWEAAKQSSLLEKVILSSEDQEIIEVAKKLGLEVPFTRPEELARDETPSIEVIKQALNFFKENGQEFDAVCLLQPTTPFRSPVLINACIKKFEENNYDSLISVREVPAEFNPHWVFEEKEGLLKLATGEESIIPRRQELPKAYFRDGAIYITKTEVLLEQNSLFGERTGFYDTTGKPYVNIDTPLDWEEAERILYSGEWRVESGE